MKKTITQISTQAINRGHVQIAYKINRVEAWRKKIDLI